MPAEVWMVWAACICLGIIVGVHEGRVRQDVAWTLVLGPVGLGLVLLGIQSRRRAGTDSRSGIEEP